MGSKQRRIKSNSREIPIVDSTRSCKSRPSHFKPPLVIEMHARCAITIKLTHLAILLKMFEVNKGNHTSNENFFRDDNFAQELPTVTVPAR